MGIKISTKLTATFGLIVILFIFLAYYSLNESRKYLKESVGKSSVFLAEEMLKRMNQGIYLKLEELQTHSSHLILHKAVSESNKEFQKLANMEAYIDQKDREWVSVPKDKITPFMQELITRDLSKHLKTDLIEFYRKKYGYKTFVELIITNKYGANIAQSGKTSDFRQNDEKWWQITREKGLYVSPVEYDESTEEQAISIGVRIDDREGDFIGIFKAVIALKSVIKSSEIALKKYETTKIKLITSDGRLIYRTGAYKFLEDVSGRDYFKQIKGDKGFFIAEAGGREKLYAYTRLKYYKDFESLGWIIVIGHDAQEVLKPVYRLRSSITAAALILISLVITIAFFVARSITKPVAMLTEGVDKIGKGDLTQRVKTRTKGEIGMLAAAFNQMAEKRQRAEGALHKAHDDLEIRVKERTADLVVSNASLKQEIADRKLSEERINHLNAVLRALRNVNKLIITEKDRSRLIKSACDNFIITRGYHNAWIALFDESGNFTGMAEAGVGEPFSRLLEMLERGDLTKCCREALGQSKVLAIANPLEACKDCPQAKGYADRAAMATRLEYEDKVYGIMTVSVPKEVATDREELSLFKEVAGDIAFALHTIEVEVKKKESQEALRRSEEFNKTIIDSSIDCIKILDLDGRLEFMSQSGQKLLEIEDIVPYLGQPWIDFWKGPDHKAAFEAVSKAKDGHTGQFQGFCPTEKGTEKWWDVITTPIIGKDGEVERLLAVSRDISSQRNIEEQFRQAQKMEAVGTLAGGVAHDFNNLLTTIIGNAQLALNDISKDDSLRKQIEEIVKAGQRSASLTRQLLAFSRKQIIQPRVLNLNEVLNGIEKMLGRLIAEDVELLLILEPALWQVEADPGQIEQVIMNLTVNARDAMPMGGKLTLETANVNLDENYYRNHGIKEEQPSSYVMLAISDTGIGMNKETQEHIFEPFYTTKEIGKGTGLGLSTVYGIVKQNNGFIWVYSEPEQGTTFKIYLPKVKEDVEAVEKERTPVGDPNGSETVLIVEDDDSLRKLAQKALQMYGYKVMEAENGEDALRVSEEYEGQIDLMVTDVVMPKMSGRETAERLQPLYPKMKVIYMSGYTDNAIAHHGVLTPGLNFLEKPFAPGALARKVREVLDK